MERYKEIGAYIKINICIEEIYKEIKIYMYIT